MGQLAAIQSKLTEIAEIQRHQEQQQINIDKQRKALEEQQKQALLEQKVQIQSLSDNQMLTTKQIMEQQQKIQQTQHLTQNVNENIQSLQQMQHQQAMQQQLNEQQLQHQIQEQQNLHAQQQLAQLAQIAAAQQQQQQQYNVNATMDPLPPPPNNNNNNNKNNNWLPSFFVFGNDKKNMTDTTVQNMDIQKNEELKHNVLGMDDVDDDDEDVLGWNNDYGDNRNNPLYHNPALLKTKSIIGEGKFAPNEKRQCGWILTNKSNALLKLSARLECIGGDKEKHGMKISTEKVYEFTLKPEEDIYVLIEVEAPSMPGKYCAFYQLVIDDGVKIGEMLEIMCHVISQFTEKKEKKIAQILKMGFNERKKVIETLQKNKWNVQQSVDQLIGL